MFLSPVFLLALPAAAIPVIIHLINRRRYRVKLWAAMRFVVPSSKRVARKLRLKQLLLLATRILLLLLLVLALARPFLSGHRILSIFSRDKPTAMIVLDNSLSMNCLQDGRSRLELAREACEGILERLPPGSSASLVLLSDRAETLFPKPITHLELVKTTLGQVEPGAGGTDLPRGIDAALDMVRQGRKLAADIYLVTDMQRNGWRMEDADGWSALRRKYAELEAKPLLRVVDVGAERKDNCALVSLEINPGRVRPSVPFEVEVVAEARGTAPGTKYFTLYLDGQKKSSVSAQNEGGSFRARFLVTVDAPGYHYGWVETDHDVLPEDDIRFFVVKTHDDTKVLCVDGEPSHEPFKGETDFLRVALDPAGGEEDYVDSPIQASVIRADALSERSLLGYEVIILANVRRPLPAVVDALERHVRDGGALIVFAGELCQLDRYNELMYAKAGGLLPARLTGIVEPEDPVTVSASESRHGLLEMIENPQKIKIRKYHGVEVDESDPSVSVVSRTSDGSPWLLERRYGKGTVYLVTVPCDADWSNFPLRPEYLPLLHKLIYTATGGSTHVLEVNDPIERDLEPGELGSEVIVRRPGEEGEAERLRGTKVLSFDRTGRAGIYTIEFRKGGRRSYCYYAFNPPREESRLEKATPDDVRDLLKGIPVEFSSGVPGRRQASAPGGREIWRLLLFGVLALVVTETWLAREMGGR